jgi:lysophospholipase L1-like esterase
MRLVHARAAVQAQKGAAWTTHRVPISEYRENLGAIVDYCRQRGVQPAFVQLPHRRQRGAPPAPAPYAEPLAQVAREKGVPLLEVGLLAPDAAQEDTSALFVDSLHLSPAGHDYLARELARQLTTLGWI